MSLGTVVEPNPQNPDPTAFTSRAWRAVGKRRAYGLDLKKTETPPDQRPGAMSTAGFPVGKGGGFFGDLIDTVAGVAKAATGAGVEPEGGLVMGGGAVPYCVSEAGRRLAAYRCKGKKCKKSKGGLVMGAGEAEPVSGGRFSDTDAVYQHYGDQIGGILQGFSKDKWQGKGRLAARKVCNLAFKHLYKRGANRRDGRGGFLGALAPFLVPVAANAISNLLS